MNVVRGTAGDEGRAIGARLSGDATTYPDLTGAQITCYLSNTDDGDDTVIVIDGSVGAADGYVTTPIEADDFRVGRWEIRWKVTGGAWYPSHDHPILIVEPSALLVVV